MKDIPVFTTENGVASLFLFEIPYRKRAHIKIQSSQEPEALLKECVDFCRACGAEWIDAAGHPHLERYPLITPLYRMECDKAKLSPSDAHLEPVTETSLRQWLDQYNTRMADVPNAAYMDTLAGEKMLQQGDGYFVYRDDELLGIGKASGDYIDTVISLQPGSGRAVVQALAAHLQTDIIKLMVAGANLRAVTLYEKMGFTKVAELSRWYRVF